MTNLVPVRDSAYQWKTLFTKLSEGKLPNINEISLEYQPVDGLPPSVTGLEGELEAPKEAGNVLPPPPEKIPIPDAYKDVVPLEYDPRKVNAMGRSRSLGTKRKASSKGKSKKRGPATKRKGAGSVTKKRSKTSTTRRKRKPITKKR